MFKRLFFVMIMVVSFNLYAQDKVVDSQISAVTVYNNSAFISRTTTVKLDAGDNSIVFDDLLANIEENSIRASASSAEVKILSAALKNEYLTKPAAENVREIQTNIVAVQDEIRVLNDEKKSLQDERKYLDSIQLFARGQLPKDLVTKMPSAQDLENTLNFLSVKIKQNYKDTAAIDLKIRDAQERMDALQRQAQELMGASNQVKRSISVDVQAAKAGTYDLVVSYMVSGASWQPLYDARADVEKNSVELVAYALIRQVTGEKWENVEMTVSTAKPVTGGRLPYVAPWFLKPQEIRVYEAQSRTLRKDSFGAKRETRCQTSAYNTMALDGLAEEAMSAAAPSPLSVVSDSGVAVTYKLPKKITIASDNNENKLAIFTQTLKADFTYSSFPKASALAYLGSRVKNAPELQLLAGKMNVFLNNEFVGSSSLDNVGPAEEFDLYLGADENVKVKRTEVEKKVDATIIGNVLGSTKSTAFKYKIKVENYKPRKIKMRLFESMPVSQDDRIKIKNLRVEPDPAQKDWENRKGVYMWEFDLEAGKNKEVNYDYTVEHPREMAVEGL